MNIWIALALVFAGAFFATLLVAIAYWLAVRPRLLALRSEAAISPSLLEQLRATMDALSDSLVRHSALVSRLPTSFEIHGPEIESITEAVLEALDAVRAEQQDLLRGLERHIVALAEQETLNDISGLLHRLEALQRQFDDQQDALTQLRARLEDLSRDAAQEAALDGQRLSDVAGAIRRLRQQATAQGQHVLALSGGASDWSAALNRLEARHAQHETTLNALEGQLAAALDRQEAHTRLLNDLVSREPTTQVVHEEKLIVQDRLQDIKGIGPVYAGRLYERGIRTFQQLAALTPDELRALAQAAVAINAESWIDQARLLASQKAKTEDLS